MVIADRERPKYMQFWNLRKVQCHHNWSDERCAREIDSYELLLKVREEAQASADPTEIPRCAWQLLGVLKSSAPYEHLDSIVGCIFLHWLARQAIAWK
jgi:hypothetical protein